LIDVQTLRRRLSQHVPRRLTEVGTAEAAVAAILSASGNEDPELFLIKRAKRDDDPWSGQMALPGGRRESEDEDLLATVCRETLEETGIVLRSADVVGELNDIRPQGPGLPRILVRPFVFLLGSRPDVLTNYEVELHLWVKFSDLPALADSATVTVAGIRINVPAFNVGPHVVWGLTERILKSFIDLCV